MVSNTRRLRDVRASFARDVYIKIYAMNGATVTELAVDMYSSRTAIKSAIIVLRAHGVVFLSKRKKKMPEGLRWYKENKDSKESVYDWVGE